MLAQAQHLRAQRGSGNGEIFRRPVLPVFPVIAAAPAQHHQDSLLIGEAEEVLGFELAFKADGVQIHVAHHADLVAQAIVVGAQQHVLRPAGAANQNRLAVHAKEAAAVGCEFRRDFANAEVDALFVGLSALSTESSASGVRGAASPIW